MLNLSVQTLVIVLSLLELILSHEQKCVKPKGEVGDTYINNCKRKECTEREGKTYGRWRTIEKNACCVMNGVKYEPNNLMATEYDDRGCNIVELYCGDGATTVISVNETCCAAEMSTQAPSTVPPSTVAPTYEGILVVGGCRGSCSDDYTRSAELLTADGSWFCQICDLPVGFGRFGASFAGNMFCGGTWSESNQKSCVSYYEGEWSLEPFTLLDRRYAPPVWPSATGDIFMGGYYYNSSTERVFDGVSSYDFDVNPIGFVGCGVATPNMMLISGGLGWYDAMDEVWSYDSAGNAYPQPPLNIKRYGHACGYYINANWETVFVVTAGTSGLTWSNTDSTEIYNIDVDSAWSFAGNYPYPAWWPVASSVANNIIVTGGRDSGTLYDDVYKFNPETLDWDYMTYLNDGREAHATTAVNLADYWGQCGGCGGGGGMSTIPWDEQKKKNPGPSERTKKKSKKTVVDTNQKIQSNVIPEDSKNN